MLILTLCCALVVGWAAGGRLSRWEAAGLRALPLPVLALLLQGLQGLLPVLAGGLVLLSYLLLALFLWWNRALRKTALLSGLGCLSNALVISVNGLRMPVSARAMACLSPAGAARLAAGEIPMYALAGADTRLGSLGDMLYCPFPLLGGFASVGDLLLAAGIFFCLLRLMAPPRLPRWMVSG